MKTAQNSALTIIEILILVFIFALLAVIAIAKFADANMRSHQNFCVHNLQTIQGAKNARREHYHGDKDLPGLTDIQPYLGSRHVESLYCPFDPNKRFESSYRIGLVGTEVICNFSLATTNYPHVLTKPSKNGMTNAAK